MTIKEELIGRFKTREARIGVLGLGYVGLPLAVIFAEAGFNVLGIDPDVRKVESVNKGHSYIQDVPTDQLAKLVKSGKIQASADFSGLKDMDAVSICVPTPLRKTGDPDMSFILSATEELANYMHPGMVVVLESSTYPGTTREILLPKLGSEKGLVVGENLFLAFSPERVDPGREDWTTYNTPKVVGGITQDCCDVATAWYEQALKTVFTVSTAEAAEMAKLLENTFRMINIGLVNELAIMCERLGVDVWEVIDAAASKPFGFMKFTPGPGLGGHCIPIDPLYLSWKMKSFNYNARFIELASEINTNMPRYTVSRVMDALNDHGKALKGSTCLVLGAAYKPNIDDIRESPALDVIGLLKNKGAKVSYHDPYIPSLLTHENERMESVPDLMAAVREADCVVIITNHKDYDYPAILEAANLVFDSRNALGKMGKNNPKVARL
ncbi:MAG: UDP-N-acetyl-D-glucosamine dehydrogenase [Chloroflexi bacterium GWB2_49_20]|nr:MAG: UDP-N-acetyl-D-glucosamine dehydrogenase [Chloroflexi bacterium GWB2_49_20]OGN80304.1 MAG: UDP-N-acetyl-D-glucosamine dehydrogenase [Chloroflexi bacterium GWC2_49_37]OGN86056.1 MAG: UDP-N-acetyl-D-glucosamine dehydrogenase [Chloroflexi bacterium GWD2_49_16]HCC79358.1 UDP-N-acetyl-D-glucosamine dehydrogenase [Anaerolineae bacterium]HCM96420.1 UDP-N-acetyl-D-glucosamine dehydrogenase [Anaerolineae bacterium]